MKNAIHSRKAIVSLTIFITILCLSQQAFSDPCDAVAGNMMLINDNGGWCWYQDDKIYYDPCGGNVLTSTAAQGSGFGGVNGERPNDMDSTTFNIATGKRTRFNAHDGGGGDDHDMGAFLIRPDGRYIHMYCPHYSQPGWSNGLPLTYYRVSTNPNDGSAWGAEQSYNWSTISGISVSAGGQLTYTNLCYMSAEGTGNGRLYNIVRWNNVTPNIGYSDDWGTTWKYMGMLNNLTISGYSNYYHKFRSNGVDRIDFIGCEAHPRDYNNCIYHGYIKGGQSYNSYGNVIDSNLFDQNAPPIGAFTRIFTAATPATDTYHTGWTVELELDNNGYPVCLYQTRHGTTPYGDDSGEWGNIGADDHRLFYARFNGSSWTSTELCMMGTGTRHGEQDYTGIGCIHPNDANLIYVSTNFDPRTDVNVGRREIFKGVTYDNGLTWNWTQITSNSTADNIRPAIPPNWNANNTVVFWTRGYDYPNEEAYNYTLVGMVEEENKTIGLVNYTDAGPSNTTNADGSAFSPTGPSGSYGSADGSWHEYTGYGNGGSCYTDGQSGSNVPTIKTTVSGLANGTYDVFAYYWCVPTPESGASGGFDTNDWGIRAGFDPCDANMLCFFRQSSQYADASQFSDPVTVTGSGVQLYRIYVGRQTVSGGGGGGGGGSISVYIGNYGSSYTGNKPYRTTYDGIGVALVIPENGDLNNDGRVDFTDFAILGQGWLSVYGWDTLASIADNWLYGT
jgi:hypothetical protein